MPSNKLRKPSKAVERGLSNIRLEMKTIAEDMSNYKSASERQRARDIFAALEYIEEAIHIASHGVAPTGEAHPLRMLTREECEVVMDTTARDTYADYANVQRKFMEVNGLAAGVKEVDGQTKPQTHADGLK